MIKKCASYVFAVGLVMVFLLTCITGARVIGASLYDFYKDINVKALAATIDGLFESIEHGFTEGFVLKEACIDNYGLFQRILGKDIIYDADDTKTVITGSDGKLYFSGNVIGEEHADDEQMRKNAENLSDFDKYLEDNGASLLFVVAPDKFSDQQVQLPVGNIEDYTETVNTFCGMLAGNNTSYVDLKSLLKEETEEYSDGFFITDHHWNIETAFWGFQKIMDYLVTEKQRDFDSKLYSESSYDFNVIPNTFLGSMGVRVGKYYVGRDDMTIISPKYDTLFEVTYKTKTLGTEVERYGSFEDAILDDDIGYSMYITSDNQEIHVDNLLNNDGHKTLLLKDSFGVPVAAWLACVSDETWIVDLRYAQQQSMYDFVKAKGIDTVIVMYNSQMLETGAVFNFRDISMGK